jgi:hypothetical protein
MNQYQIAVIADRFHKDSFNRKQALQGWMNQYAVRMKTHASREFVRHA